MHKFEDVLEVNIKCYQYFFFKFRREIITFLVVVQIQYDIDILYK